MKKLLKEPIKFIDLKELAMQLYLQDEERIYFPQTRKYLQEVLNSFAIGNYRSAVVMLYRLLFMIYY